MENLVQVMREYAQAIRSDWSSIDGRAHKLVLEGWADRLESGQDFSSLLDAREDANVCLSGGDHWTDYCDADCEAW